MANYTQLSRDTVDIMNKSLKDLKAAIDTLKKAKGDKKKIQELTAQVDLKSKNLAAKVLADFKIAKTGCDAMTLQIETYLKASVESVQEAKKAAERYKLSRENRDKTIVEFSPVHLKTYYDLAAQEMENYAVSWNCYRSNWGDAVDKSYLKESEAIREVIIQLTKTARGKTDRMLQMSKEVEPLKMVVADAGALQLASPEEKVEELEKLLATLKEMSKPLAVGKETVEVVINNFPVFQGKLKQKKEVIKAGMKANEQAYAFNVKSVQNFVSALASMKKALATGKSAVHAMYLKDNHVAAKIKECEDYVGEWEGKVKQTQVIVNEMAKILTQLQQIAKK